MITVGRLHDQPIENNAICWQIATSLEPIEAIQQAVNLLCCVFSTIYLQNGTLVQFFHIYCFPALSLKINFENAPINSL